MSDSNAHWNLLPPPGFRGFLEHLPMRVYERNLPHWRQEGATYFVTFRLADSLPNSKLEELQAFKREFEFNNPPPRSSELLDEIAREMFRRIEGWLDQGLGSCVLKDSRFSKRIVESMHKRDGIDYELGCYVFMANHVHAILRPLKPGDNDLELILRAWKGSSACEINRDRGESGALWQQESYDRIIRDEDHLWRVIQYIGRNPKNAGLNPSETPLWIRQEWKEQGWRFEETISS